MSDFQTDPMADAINPNAGNGSAQQASFFNGANDKELREVFEAPTGRSAYPAVKTLAATGALWPKIEPILNDSELDSDPFRRNRVMLETLVKLKPSLAEDYSETALVSALQRAVNTAAKRIAESHKSTKYRRLVNGKVKTKLLSYTPPTAA